MLTKFYVFFLVVMSVVFQMNLNFQDVNNDVKKDLPIKDRNCSQKDIPYIQL